MVLYADNAEPLEWFNMCWRKVRLCAWLLVAQHIVDNIVIIQIKPKITAVSLHDCSAYEALPYPMQLMAFDLLLAPYSILVSRRPHLGSCHRCR